MSHPSYLELDRHALGAGCDPGTAAHLAGCERCRDYVATARPADVVPAWVAELGATPRKRVKPWWLAAGVAAAAALVLIWRSPSELYVGTKGMPSAFVYVHRDHTTTLWDQTPLHAGDRIRLEVAPEEFEQVTVFSTDAQGNKAEPLYAGRTKPFTRTLLPKAWQLDAVGHAEHLAVVFSHAELSREAASALFRARDPAEVRIVRLTLQKE
jgi:hypothetical protein